MFVGSSRYFDDLLSYLVAFASAEVQHLKPVPLSIEHILLLDPSI